MVSDGLELPTEELREAAFKLFGETNETREIKLNELHNMVRELPDCSTIDCRSVSLIRFLRGHQFNVQNAFSAIKNKIDFNIKYPHWTSNLTNDEFSLFKSVVHILNVRDIDGRLMVFVKISNYLQTLTPQFMDNFPHAVIRMNILTIEYFSKNPIVQVYGLRRIFSFADLTFWESKKIIGLVAPINDRVAYYNYMVNCSPFKTREWLFVRC